MSLMIRSFQLALLGGLLLCCVDSAVATEKRYALPERGFFQMDVPSGWSDQVRQARALPPTFAFRPGKGQPFEVLVTPIWTARADVPASTKDSIRKQVGRAVDEVRSQSLDQRTRLV